MNDKQKYPFTVRGSRMYLLLLFTVSNLDSDRKLQFWYNVHSQNLFSPIQNILGVLSLHTNRYTQIHSKKWSFWIHGILKRGDQSKYRG